MWSNKHKITHLRLSGVARTGKSTTPVQLLDCFGANYVFCKCLLLVKQSDLGKAAKPIGILPPEKANVLPLLQFDLAE